MINTLLLLGIAVVLPMAVGGRWRWWLGVAALGGASLALPRGWGAAALTLPWAALAGARAIETARPRPNLQALPAAYALVAAGALFISRLGGHPLDLREPIIELTAVHYTYAGAAAMSLALAAGPGRRADAARILTAAAPLVVATGFVTHAALPQVGGAVLMALGVFLTATLHLRAAAQRRTPSAGRVLLAVSGLAIWIPMALAVAWAAGQHWNIPALSIPAMARTHGVANALGFTVCGLLGRRLIGRVA